MKKVVILGSTGSVGINALDVIRRHKDKFKVVGLAANKNALLLAMQANRFKPRLLALGDAAQYRVLKGALKGTCKILTGMGGVCEVASMKEAQLVLAAIGGSACILPLMAAIKAKKRIALANKEAIVSAGNIILNMVRLHGAEIIPIDSEHNSIFQCIRNEKKENISRIFLMGTGGPLRGVPKSIFDSLKPSKILAHPVWKMGRKISVDSATLMNKGLEVIEASFLFGIEASRIEVLLHPEAIIHSMVELRDGNIMANLFYPDMKLPIFYALNYPARGMLRFPKVDFSRIRGISFQKPDRKSFPALKLCYEAVKKGGTYPAVLSSANEEAVKFYLDGKIKFTHIVDMVKKVLGRHRNIKKPSIDEILYVDRWAKAEAGKILNLKQI